MIAYWVLLGGFVLSVALAHATGVLRLDADLPKRAWVIGAMIAFTGSWMLFDGARALVVGDFVTPGGSGELGPWAALARALGIDPRSTPMKAAFVIQGGATLAASLAFVTHRTRGWRGMAVVSVLALWYLPFGTLFGVVAAVLLMTPGVRRHWTRQETS